MKSFWCRMHGVGKPPLDRFYCGYTWARLSPQPVSDAHSVDLLRIPHLVHGSILHDKPYEYGTMFRMFHRFGQHYLNNIRNSQHVLPRMISSIAVATANIDPGQ